MTKQINGCGHIEKGYCPECSAEIDHRRKEILHETPVGRRVLMAEAYRTIERRDSHTGEKNKKEDI